MFTYRKLKLKSKNKSVEIFSIINYISRRKTSIDIHVSYDLLIKHIAQLCELIISGVEMYENMIIYCLISTAMGIGRDCQSQRFLSLGLQSQSSKSRDGPNDFCPIPKSPRDCCPLETLGQPEFLGLLGTRVPRTVLGFRYFLKKHDYS